ncbi:hypothetical protein AHiyo8_24560 [Arthrobacter sp. Hiyo8]|nr:hypothetical protein AHiyo8_24560 [Arthrobacter sp. Hiyo8]
MGSSIPTDKNSGHLAVAPDGTLIVTSPGNGTGDGSVSRYAAVAAGATTSAASKPAPAATTARTQSDDGTVSPWSIITAIGGAAAIVAIAVAVFIVASGRRKRSALGDGGKPRSAT